MNPAVRQARGAENHSRLKSVSTQKSQSDHTRHPTGRAAPGSAAAAAARRPSSCSRPSRAEVGQTSESRTAAGIRRQLSITTIMYTGGRTALASRRAIFAIHRCRRAAATPTTLAHEACRGTCSLSRCQRRGFMGSSRREEALKKPSAIGSASGSLPSPPKRHEEFPR